MPDALAPDIGFVGGFFINKFGVGLGRYEHAINTTIKALLCVPPPDWNIMRLILTVFITTVILSMCSRRTLSDDFSLKGGPAIVDGAPSGEAKYFGIRYEEYLIYGFSHAFEVGGWVDNAGKGQRSSLIGKVQLGMTPGTATGVFAKLFTGFCPISATDTLLGSHPQFCTDVGVGVRDRHTAVSFGYMHVSNAGLFSDINKGRDFLLLEATIRL